MHTTLKSALFAASMLVCLSAHAVIADSINQNSLPAYNSGGEDNAPFEPTLFTVSQITYKYVPLFDYTLTGLETRFSTAGVTNPNDARTISVTISSNAGVLQSFSFQLLPSTVDLAPGIASTGVHTGTDWLGGSFSSLSLFANEDYYITLSGLTDPNWSAGVNTVNHITQISAAGVVTNFGTTPVQTVEFGSDVTYYSDPIFRFSSSSVAPVPEPSTYGLFGAFGLLGFAAVRRRLVRKS